MSVLSQSKKKVEERKGTQKLLVSSDSVNETHPQASYLTRIQACSLKMILGSVWLHPSHVEFTEHGNLQT